MDLPPPICTAVSRLYMPLIMGLGYMLSLYPAAPYSLYVFAMTYYPRCTDPTKPYDESHLFRWSAIGGDSRAVDPRPLLLRNLFSRLSLFSNFHVEFFSQWRAITTSAFSWVHTHKHSPDPALARYFHEVSTAAQIDTAVYIKRAFISPVGSHTSTRRGREISHPLWSHPSLVVCGGLE